MDTLYTTLKRLVGIFFNLINMLMKGNLPPLGCATFIIEEHNNYLVVERASGELVFPGGFIRWREHPTQTAQREAKEETGFSIRVGAALGYYSVVSDETYCMSTLNITFVGYRIGGELHTSIEGKPQWCDEQTIRKAMNAYYASMLDDYLLYRQRQKELPALPS